jgi:hypothetical protein
MKRDPKHTVMYILAGGLMFLLVLIVVADFSTALRAGRAPDEGVIELIKMSITGVVGIIAGWFAGKADHDDRSE